MRKFIAGLSMAMIQALTLTAVATHGADVKYGDANCDGDVNMADVATIVQYIGNKDAYSLTEQGLDNADVSNRGDGVTGADAYAVQKFIAGELKSLPESVTGDSGDKGDSGDTGDTGETSEYKIKFNGSEIDTDAPADTATVADSVITITREGSYNITGTGEEVQIIVDVDKTAYPDAVVELNLKGVELTNSTAAPIYVESIGDEVQIIAKSGTDNTISDGTANTNDGAIYAEDDIKIKGSGNLVVNGNTSDGIVCKNDIKIYNGNITVNAVDDGIRGKDSVTVGNAKDTDFSGLNLTVNTQQGDGIKSTSTTECDGTVEINGGNVNITSYADGIQAEQAVEINGGELTIYTYEGSGFGGTSDGNSSQPGGFGGGFGGGMQEGNSNKTDISAKGIKAVGLYDTDGTTLLTGGEITINGGKITIDSSDDCIHCSGEIETEGGILKLATADDALHADGDVILGEENGADNDFEIYVTKCYEGIEGNNIHQYRGTVVVKSGDDGYNAAGGADNSGSGNNMGWGQGGFGGNMGGSGGNLLEITGGVAIVQSASGDHDGFDSNGNVNITGGIVIANGQETIDCGDGYSENITGGTVVECSSQGTGAIQAGEQFTVADADGNVIVSFTTMQNMGSPVLNNTSLKCYTGGTITGGTNLITSDEAMAVYTDGAIAGGTAVSAGGGFSGGNNRPW